MNSGIRYSESFKKQVVDELGSGKFRTPGHASRNYGIRGAETVRSWLLKYGRDDLLSKRVMVSTMKEVNELKAARKRIRTLEAALADAHVDNCLEHAFLEIACERMDTDISDFKKKNELTLSDVRKTRGLS